MLIKKLIIHNIASIADAEIDFHGPELSDTPIFLISGETGAGKSTILDSICLALYDNTPRMSSSFKEELTLFSDGRNKAYANDNAQFLRRGTGEGFVSLTYEGNDGRLYEAVWAVQRDHKKPHKKLQKPSRTLRTVSDNTFSETHKQQIEEKIKATTGMDFDQFCRTVMLAQGEFTKFLKSKKNEKSQILEKLTGTEIYSIIGSRLSMRYSDVKTRWERLHEETERFMTLPPEELDEIKKNIAELQAAKTELDKSVALLAGKTKWIADRDGLDKKKKETEEIIRTLTEATESESFKNDSILVKEYRETTEVRLHLRQISELEKALESQRSEKIRLEADHKTRKEAEEKSGKEIEKAREDVKLKADELDSLKIEEANRQISILNERSSVMAELRHSMSDLDSKKKTLKELNSDMLSEKQSEEKLKISLTKLAPEIKKWEEKCKETLSRFEKLFTATTSAAKNLRATLEKGDTCPVCGQTILSELKDSVFEEILKPVREEKEAAEEECKNLKAKKMSEEALLKKSAANLEKITSRFQRVKTEIESIETKIAETLEKAGWQETDRELIPGMMDGEEIRIREEKGKAEKIQNRHTAVSSELKKLQKAEERKKRDHEEILANVAKTEKEMAVCENSIKEKNADIEKCKRSLEYFFAVHPGITQERLSLLDSASEREIETLEEKIRNASDSLKQEQGALRQLTLQIEQKESEKPEFEEGETLEQLLSETEKTKEESDSKSRAMGSLQQRLDTDTHNRTILKGKKEEEEKARTEKDKWEGLYRLLGDQDGSKFRSVAQSFILKSLLDNANGYMTTFTDRYTLTCNPGSLVILVADALHPSDPQPASILSGGESFMASLSLALALSNLKGGALGVDVLFIDEGFGTLSPEYLGNVMDTLEKLHRIGGRKVGLISHVPEMKERIPVQINVHRDSPTLSKVSLRVIS